MTTTTFELNCPICLPCGHLCCDACIKEHVQGSSDSYKSTCPTCRAPFPIVKPDMSIVPKKYHKFIFPPLRRVFLDGREDNSHVVNEILNAEIAALEERVTLLNRDNILLVDRCNSAQRELAHLSSCKAEADALKVKEVLNRLIWHGVQTGGGTGSNL